MYSSLTELDGKVFWYAGRKQFVLGAMAVPES